MDERDDKQVEGMVGTHPRGGQVYVQHQWVELQQWQLQQVQQQ